MKKGLIFSVLLFLFACSTTTENKDGKNDATALKIDALDFDTFDEKISYCIGLDHARGCYTVYTGPKTIGKFSISEIEKAMTDYLGDKDLEMAIYETDSILDLYLQENGEVDDSQVSIQTASYAVGLGEAQYLVASLVGRGIDQNMDINYLLKGIEDGMRNIPSSISYDEARQEVGLYYIDLNRKLGERFLAENRERDSVVSTSTGLQYKVIKEGTGISPNLTDSVTVHFTGRFLDGRVFESSVPSLIPVKFTLISVIPGWKEGLLLMKEGGSARLFIPYNLAYGEAGNGIIEPYSTLVFDIDLIKVKRFNPAY